MEAGQALSMNLEFGNTDIRTKMITVVVDELV